MRDEALSFIDQHADAPFFLDFATTVPHMADDVKLAEEMFAARTRARPAESTYD